MGVHRVIQRGDAEVGFHGVRQTPGQDLARRPVDDGDEIEKAPPHRDIGHVGAPDVVGPFNDELPQQIGIRLVRGMRLARPRRLIDRRKAGAGIRERSGARDEVVLQMLRSEPGQRSGRIAAALGEMPTTTTKRLTRLAARGAVTGGGAEGWRATA